MTTKKLSPCVCECLIYAALSSDNSLDDIMNYIVKTWGHVNADFKEKKAVISFLFFSKYYYTLVKLCSNWIIHNKKIPWSFLLETLHVNNIEASFSSQDEIKDSFSKVYIQTPPSFTKWGFVSKLFKDLQKKNIKKIKETQRNKKQEFLKQLKLTEDYNLLEKQKDILEQFQAFFPQDPEIKEYLNKIKKKKQK